MVHSGKTNEGILLPLPRAAAPDVLLACAAAAPAVCCCPWHVLLLPLTCAAPGVWCYSWHVLLLLLNCAAPDVCRLWRVLPNTLSGLPAVVGASMQALQGAGVNSAAECAEKCCEICGCVHFTW